MEAGVIHEKGEAEILGISERLVCNLLRINRKYSFGIFVFIGFWEFSILTINCKDSKIELVNRKIVLFSVYFQLKLKYIKKRGEKLGER